MYKITGLIAISGVITWQVFGHRSFDDEEGLVVGFPLFRQTSRRAALKTVREALRNNNVDWLTADERGWVLDLDRTRAAFPEFLDATPWLKGRVPIEVEVEDEECEVFHEKRRETVVRFIATKEWIALNLPRKIFLSHKGADKPRVREFFATLSAIGLEPWLDEDAMPAGEKLERGIRQGFSDSCAAVFFITSAFADQGYLETEIDYAIQEKREKGDRFAIITLVFADAHGNQPSVPRLLQPYVWKAPRSDLEAVREILRSLPLRLVPQWRENRS